MADSAIYSLISAFAFWLAVAAIWGYSSHGIFRENKQIKEELPTLPTMHYLLKRLAALQKRNLQLWAAVTVLFAICAIGNLYSIIHSTPAPAPAPVIAVAEPVRMQPLPVVKPVVIEKKAPETPVSTAPVPATNSLPYSDITEFNEKDSKQQAMIDWLKQRYENSLITYYYLQKCGLADKNDFDLIRGSLHKELSDLHTETNAVEDNILLAANGSYNELYSQASCSDDRTKITKASYDTFMQQMRQPPARQAAQPQNPVQENTPSSQTR